MTSSGAFTIVMNHHVERDQESLHFCLDSEAAYIGVLGPRARYETLLAGLAAQDYTPDASKLLRVRSPVGLSLGAETPHEVAVSIIGEILAIRRGFDGRFLSGSVSQPSRPGRETTPGQLVVFGCVHIHQQIGRKPQDCGPLEMPEQDRRAPCCNWANSGKNSRSKRCGGAITSPYRTLTMGARVCRRRRGPVGTRAL